MRYTIEEYIDGNWIKEGTAKFEKSSISMTLEVLSAKNSQRITASIDKEFYSNFCVDDIVINSKRLIAESKKKCGKRKFTIIKQGRKEKFNLHYKSAIYSKLAPFLISEIIEYYGEDIYLNAYSNFINNYFYLHFKRVVDVEYKNKWCKHYLIITIQNGLQIISSVYIDEIGMLALVENKKRIIRES